MPRLEVPPVDEAMDMAERMALEQIELLAEMIARLPAARLAPVRGC